MVKPLLFGSSVWFEVSCTSPSTHLGRQTVDTHWSLGPRYAVAYLNVSLQNKLCSGLTSKRGWKIAWPARIMSLGVWRAKGGLPSLRINSSLWGSGLTSRTRSDTSDSKVFDGKSSFSRFYSDKIFGNCNVLTFSKNTACYGWNAHIDVTCYMMHCSNFTSEGNA